MIFVLQKFLLKKLEKKIGDVDQKIPDVSGLVTTSVLDKQISELKNEIPGASDLAKKTNYDSRKSRKSVLVLLNLRVTYLMQR